MNIIYLLALGKASRVKKCDRGEVSCENKLLEDTLANEANVYLVFLLSNV